MSEGHIILLGGKMTFDKNVNFLHIDSWAFLAARGGRSVVGRPGGPSRAFRTHRPQR